MEMMNGRKMFFMVVIVMMVGAFLGGLFARQQSASSQSYPLTAVVTNIDEDADTVTVTDFNGFDWVFEGVEDWSVGSIASLIMDDNGTESILDDTIVSCRYGGWVDGAWGWNGQRPLTYFG